jgi:hypothetical protein
MFSEVGIIEEVCVTRFMFELGGNFPYADMYATPFGEDGNLYYLVTQAPIKNPILIRGSK